MHGFALLKAALLLFSTRAVFAAVHTYNDDYFYAVADAYIFRGGREGLYASTREALERWADFGQVTPGIANGQSEIMLDRLEFHRPDSVANQYGPDEGWTGLIQAVLFEVNDRDKIGYPSPQGYRYCCVKELVPKTKCHLDRLIHREGADGPQVIDIYFEHNQTVAKPQDRSIKIKDSGMYYLWFVNCDEDLSASTVAGSTVWKNPGGYLPGMMFPHIAFFAVMTILYLILMTVWGLLYARHWTDVFFLQHFMTAVIVLGALEMSAWYFDYVNFNVTGHRPVVPTIWAVLMGDVRKTTSRVLIVMVSMGYGVVIPFLADLQKKQLLCLGVVYFVTVSVLDGISNVAAIDDLTSAATLVLSVPVALMDGVFILWVFQNLSKTLRLLQFRNATGKLQLYRRFTNALAAWVWVSIAWAVYELYSKVADQYNEHWRTHWVTSDFWHVLNFAFLCVIAFLWRPSANAQRFAYSELDDEDMSVESGKRPPNGHDHKTKPPKPPRQAAHIDGITPDDAAKEN